MSYKEGTARYYLAVSGGYAEVLDNVMTVLAPAAEFAGEITDRARQAKESAEKRIAELNYEDKEFNSAATALGGLMPGFRSPAKKPEIKPI